MGEGFRERGQGQGQVDDGSLDGTDVWDDQRGNIHIPLGGAPAAVSARGETMPLEESVLLGWKHRMLWPLLDM